MAFPSGTTPAFGCQPHSVLVIFKAFSDDDLASIVDGGGYSPDKKKGKR